jgi:hypothetical protein
MKTKYVIQISFPHPDGYLWEAGSDYEEFIDRYAAYTNETAIKFFFPEKPKFFEALSFLKKQGLRYIRHYKFELAPDELESYPALSLGMMLLRVDSCYTFISAVESEVQNGSEIINDVATGRIIVSPRVQEILEEMTSGIEWIPQPISAGVEWFWMVAQPLPSPIFIPNPSDVFPNEYSIIPDVYEVESEGRCVANDTNIAFLAEVGIAMNGQCETPTTFIKVSPEAIATGKIIKALDSVGVKDILKNSFPLLTSSHPLSH